MTEVLILDGQQRSALAAARSLGKQGIRVHIADFVAPTLAGSSKYVASQLVCPDPHNEAAQFTDWTLEQADRLGVQMVLPLTDASTMLLAPVQDRLSPAKLACAPARAYEEVSDKARLLKLAAAADVQTPKTTVIDGLIDLDAHLKRAEFPLVLKPARSKILVGNAIVSTSVHIAHSYQDAISYLRQQSWPDKVPCLVQEYIEGHGAGVFAFYAHGQPLAWFAHRRIREKPPSGGVSVLSESQAVDDRLKSSADRILCAVGWEGAAMVEFKIGKDGSPYLMEINGRLWGSLQLAIDSGVDFPWLLYQAAVGKPPSSQAQYRCGQRLRWLMGDVDNLLIQLRASGQPVSSKLSAIGRFLTAFFDGSRQEILRWDDAGPAVFEFKAWAKALL